MGLRVRLVRLMQDNSRESKRGKKGDFSLFAECKVFFESELVGFKVYCINLCIKVNKLSTEIKIILNHV